MESFDPLDLFSPDVRKRHNEGLFLTSLGVDKQDQPNNEETVLKETIDHEEEVVHMFDLPHIVCKPPFDVLLFILRLFQPEIRYNFSSIGVKTDVDAADDDLAFFTSKDISEEHLSSCIEWFKQRGLFKLTNIGSLKTVPSIRSSCSNEFFSYMTSIVSSDLSWIQKDSAKDTNAARDTIWKIASLRLAENCGRTAQPSFVRRVVFDRVSGEDSKEFCKTDSGAVCGEKFNVKLKEPSLTADNLGLKTWGSSLVLSERLLLNYSRAKAPREYLKKPILELGSGTGLVGIMCGLLDKENLLKQAKSSSVPDIILTDLPEITPNLQENVKLNDLNDNCKVFNLDWTDSSSFDTSLDINNNTNVFNTIILSDPVYSAQHPPLIVSMIKKYLNFDSTQGSIVLLEIPAREHYERERTLLWSLISKDPVLSKLILVDEAVEDGFDDYGSQKLIFKCWKTV